MDDGGAEKYSILGLAGMGIISLRRIIEVEGRMRLRVKESRVQRTLAI